MRHLGEYVIPQIFNNPKLNYYPQDNIQGLNLNLIIIDWNQEFGDLSRTLRKPDFFSKTIEYNGRWTLRMCYGERRSDYYDFIWGNDGHFIDFRKVQ